MTFPWSRLAARGSWQGAWRAARRAQEARLLAPIAALGGAVWAFMKIASEVLEGEAHALDLSVLLWCRVDGMPDQPRGPLWLQEGMRDLTALGSPAVLAFAVLAVWGGLMTAGAVANGHAGAVLYGGVRDLVEIRRDYDPSLPEIVGDREQLIQAVLNIAHNAAHALSERIAAGDAVLIMRTRVARRVTINRHLHRLALVLHIEDNGPGIPPAIRDRVFYPLVSGREGGSGLGLTLAQTFVQQHQGTIECESEPGRTVFRILIPMP